jgi:hypothetical protein
MAKNMKKTLSDEEFLKLSQEEAKLYEFVVTTKPSFRIKHVLKDFYYGNVKDIVPDKFCDLSFLEGCKIKKIGFHKKAKEGGLSLVYEKNGKERIVVLGFTELGMWVYADTPTVKKSAK